jgi:hypothetical protein
LICIAEILFLYSGLASDPADQSVAYVGRLRLQNFRSGQEVRKLNYFHYVPLDYIVQHIDATVLFSL